MNDDNRVIVVEAGTATAYGSAVEGGYTGTYEDFCRQQAGYAESAEAVEQAKNTAVSAANTATTKAGEATTAATAAQTARTQTEQSASQALTDIAAARSDAISAVQTEGTTQTANATAQAQAAATSANTASTKASEASASATTATTKATEAAASATSAAQSASDAQDVLDSIPEDYSDLSEGVDKLKADLSDNNRIIHSVSSEIIGQQYKVLKIADGKIGFVSNPPGYWKSLIAPVENLYIDGVAKLTANYLQGNESLSIPSMAFCDEEYNVIGTPSYGQHLSPKTFQKSDVPVGACYVCLNGSTFFKFDFASTDALLSQTLQLKDATSELTGDVVNLTYTSATGYYNKTRGFATYPGVTTAKISVSEGEQYLLDSRSYFDAAIACLLNSSGVVQSTVWISRDTAQQKDIIITIPSGISYLLIQRLYAYKPTILRKVTGIKAKSVQSILNGKRVTVIGDSITELNLRANMNWALWINEWANATIQNLGKSGTGFIAGGTNNYANRIASISNPDIIGVACSFNDMNNTIADLTTAAETFFDNLITAYPTTPIICYVQSPWSAYHYGVTTSDAWVDALREVCNKRGIPFYDGMYKGTVLKPWLSENRAVYYINDGDGSTGEEDWVHPNSEGHKAIARYLYPKFAENIVASGLDYMTYII